MDDQSDIFVAGKSGTCIQTKMVSVNFREYAFSDFFDEDQSLLVPPASRLGTLLEYGAGENSWEFNNPLHPANDTARELINDKWIYVFSTADGIRVQYEIQVAAESDIQTFKYIDWSGSPDAVKSRWEKTFPREPGSKKKKCLLDLSGDLSIFVSQEQLTYKRLQDYLETPMLLPSRALKISGGFCVKEDEPVPICLVDFIKISAELLGKLHETFEKRDEYQQKKVDFFEDNDNKARFDYASMVKGLADSYEKVRKNVQYDKLTEYINEKTFTEEIARETTLIEDTTIHLTSWMETPWYEETVADYKANDELLAVIAEHHGPIIHQLRRTQEGGTYIEKLWERDDSWINALFNDPDYEFEKMWPSIRKIASAPNVVIDFVLDWAEVDILRSIIDEKNYLRKAAQAQTIAFTLSAEEQEMLDKVKRMKTNKGPRGGKKITHAQRSRLMKARLQKWIKRYEIPDGSPEKVKFINENSSQLLYDNGLNLRSQKDVSIARDGMVSILEENYKNAEKVKTAEAKKFKDEADAAGLKMVEAEAMGKKADSLKPVPARLALIADRVNALLAVKSFADSVTDYGTSLTDKSFETLNLVGSTMDALSHHEKMIRTLFKKQIFKNTKAIQMRAGRQITTKIARQAATRVIFAEINIISSTIDAMVTGYAIYKNVRKGAYRQVIGDAVCEVGYIMAVAGSGYVVWNLMAGETLAAIGLLPFGIGLAAAALIIAGNIIAYVLREQPLRDWARDSLVGEKTAFGEFLGSNPKKIEGSIKQLIGKFAEFRIYPYLKTYDTDGLTLPERRDDIGIKGFSIRILPGAFEPAKSKIYCSIHAYEANLINSDTTIFKDDFVCFDTTTSYFGYKDGKKESGLSFIERFWTIQELESLAKKNNYYTGDFQKLMQEWKERSYYERINKMNTEIDDRFTFKAIWQARLDFKGDQITLDNFKKDHTEGELMIFPSEEPYEDKEQFRAYNRFRVETLADSMIRLFER